MNITRTQLIAEIDRRQPDERPAGWPWGNVRKYDRAAALRRHLESGGTPTVAQVVGYFGKGARFVDEETR